MGSLMTELEKRWRGMFVALAGGGDLPPAKRLRAEGLMEAAVLAGEATEAEVVEAMGRC